METVQRAYFYENWNSLDTGLDVTHWSSDLDVGDSLGCGLDVEEEDNSWIVQHGYGHQRIWIFGK